MKLGIPGFQFHNYFGDTFVLLGTPLEHACAFCMATQLFQSIQLLSKCSSGHSWLKEDGLGCPAPVRSFISQFQMATLQTGSTADVDTCSVNCSRC